MPLVKDKEETDMPLKETVQLRRELEGLAAELATRKIQPEQLARLRSLLDDAIFTKDQYPESLVKMSDIDVQIHQLIYKIAGNTQLTDIINTLLDKMTMFWFQVGFSGSDFHQQFEELEHLYTAMVEKDSQRAREIMKDHVQHFTELITQNFF